MSWLVVHTKPRLESEALLQLQRQGYQAYLPQLRIETVRRGKFDERLIPLFPRYLFVRSPEDPRQSWGPIRYTRGVQRLVSFGHEPALMDDGVVEWIKSEESRQATQPLFAAGEAVQITKGPFIGLEGVFQMTNGEQRALVLIEILSKPVVLKVAPTELKRVS
jgi:transcriptional antiterminator RfaH